MSYGSLEAGHASSAGHSASAGAILYLLRTLERDLRERGVRAAVYALRGRAEGIAAPPDPSDLDLADWLLSDDSPLLLDNVGELITDPDAHLRAVAERLEGAGRDRPPSGRELTGTAPRLRAAEFQASLRTLAELDAERVAAVPRRRGTPKGQTRTHYLLLVSPPHDIPNAEFKRLVLEIIRRRWPGAVVVGYIHRDTANTHLHVWLSAETLSGKKIDVRRVRPSGDAILDKYPDLDEDVARALSRHFGDESIYSNHLAKKKEWVYWRERFEAALVRGERPPVMPYRARHEYDGLAERIALAERERGEAGVARAGKAEKAAPVPRTKSLMGALELWGKVEHLRARVAYRRALLASLDGWEPLIAYPIDSVREACERQLAETEREFERHERAYELTLRNRAREGYPELKYPLHNRKQIDEMREIALLTRDAELLRRVHAYDVLGRPTESAELCREVGERWRDEILARVEVLERGELLGRVALRNLRGDGDGEPGEVPAVRTPAFDRDAEIVAAWSGGGWTTRQRRDSLGCFADECTRHHAERYLNSLDYLGAAREVLADYSAGADARAARPSFAEDDVARINGLLARAGALTDARDRAYWSEVTTYAAGSRELTPAKFQRLLDHPPEPAGITLPDGTGRRHNALGPLRPYDDRWAGRLRLATASKQLEAAALAMAGESQSRYERTRDVAVSLRETLALTRDLRRASGLDPDPPPAAPTAVEERARARHEAVISQQLQTRGESWREWQVSAVRECLDCLPAPQRRRAGRLAGLAESRLEEEKLREQLSTLVRRFDEAAQFLISGTYDAGGLDALRDPGRRGAHADELTARFTQILQDSSYPPERLGLGEAELRGRARTALDAGVERLEREEHEAYELARHEAQTILARARRDAAAAGLERFDAHAFFYEWEYQTADGPERMSFAEATVAVGEGIDPALALVARDAGPHIINGVEERHARLAAEALERAREAEAAEARYAEALEDVQRRPARTRPPAFTAEEVSRLEECAALTRDPTLVEIISRCDEQLFGAEYAERRALGRAITAGLAESKERALVSKYEHPLNLSEHPRLVPSARALLSEALERHREAHARELSSAADYHAAWRARAEELKAVVAPGRKGPCVALMTHAEAEQAYAYMSPRERTNIGRSMSGVEVMPQAEQPRSGRPGEGRDKEFAAWAAKNFGGSAYLRHEYVRSLGETNVLSRRQAQREVEHQRPTRGRRG